MIYLIVVFLLEFIYIFLLSVGIVGNFSEMVEDFCSKAEFPDDLELADEQSLPLAEIKTLVNQIMSIRSKKVLHLVPLDILVRLLGVLDRQIQCAQGMSSDGNDNDNVSVFSLSYLAFSVSYF